MWPAWGRLQADLQDYISDTAPSGLLPDLLAASLFQMLSRTESPNIPRGGEFCHGWHLLYNYRQFQVLPPRIEVGKQGC